MAAHVYIDARDQDGKLIGYALYNTKSTNVPLVHKNALRRAQKLWPDAREWNVGPTNTKNEREPS